MGRILRTERTSAFGVLALSRAIDATHPAYAEGSRSLAKEIRIFTKPAPRNLHFTKD